MVWCWQSERWATWYGSVRLNRDKRVARPFRGRSLLPRTTPLSLTSSEAHVSAPRSRSRALRTLSCALIAVGACLTTAGLVSSPAQAEPARSVSVSPGDQLADGQWVRVSWQGFTGDDPVDVRQCAPAATSLTQCSRLLTNAATTAGSGAVTFQVHAGALTASDACDTTHPCSVVVFEDTAPEDFTTDAAAPISFAKTPASCPQDQTGLTALGNDAVARAMFRWQPALCDAPYRAPLDFTTGNDVQGRRDAWRGLRDLGVTQDPLSADDQAMPTVTRRSFTYVPLTASAVGFAYNLHDARTGAQIDDLKLTPELLALIFTGQIDNWNDPRILALNPGHRLPTAVKPIARADGAGITLEVTRYFEATARAAYEQGGRAYQGGPTDTYPSTGFVDLRTGGNAVAQALTKPDDSDYSVYGYIGMLDSSAAAFNGLPMVQVANAAGAFVAPTPVSISAGLSHMVASADGVTAVPAFDSNDPTAYPLPTLTTAMVPTSQVTKATGAALHTILTYATGKGQTVLPGGYAALPPELTALATRQIAKIPVPDEHAPTPSPPATATPRPTSPGGPGSSVTPVGGLPGGGGVPAGTNPGVLAPGPAPATTPSSAETPPVPVAATAVDAQPAPRPVVLPVPVRHPAPLVPGVVLLSSGAALGGSLLLRREVKP